MKSNRGTMVNIRPDIPPPVDSHKKPISPRHTLFFGATLRAKFLLSLAVISGLLTWITLLIVRHRVQLGVREEIVEGLRNSVVTFQNLQQQRAMTLEQQAALLASLPPLKAVMTSQHVATIQDASAEFWHLVGSQLFVLADSSGRLVALHTSSPGFTQFEAQEHLAHSLDQRDTRDWWFGSGKLFEVFLQPIYFGAPAEDTPIGILAVGYEIDRDVADDISRVASSRVAFRYGKTVVVSTLSPLQQTDFANHHEALQTREFRPTEIQVAGERFLASSVGLSPGRSPEVSLTVLKSFDEATRYLESLNRWILALGVAAVLAGSALVFLISTTFTRPLADLIAGVRALEDGNFDYPLVVRGSDEISVLTAAFHRMRRSLQDTQRKLLDAERLGTIGRMASTISHDLRHPLTAILAYAEFLSEGNLSETQRKDFYEEIRLAVNQMLDEVNSLLGFSKQQEALRPVLADIREVIQRAIHTVQALPEFQKISISFTHQGEESAWFDPGKLERVILNLLFNACEAVSGDSGRVEVSSQRTDDGVEIRVADNGSGIPEEIRDSLFQPFVSHGKEKGIGLGLTVVQKIIHDHGGDVSLDSTGSGGSVFKLIIPLPKGIAIG